MINFKRRNAFRPTIVFLCMLFGSHFSGFQAQAQINLSLDLQNVPLEQVFSAIEARTSYRFLYNKELVEVTRKVSVNVQNKDLSVVLSQLFAGTDITYILKNRQIVLSRTSEKQSQPIKTLKKVTGKIVDEKGEPIIGANIVEAGTANGTVTDVDGNFSLSVDNNATIHISYIGYLEQDINTAGRTSFNITLIEDTKALDEVVVVGYGIQKKVNLSGAVATADTKKLEDRPITTIGNALQGTVASLNIDPRSGDPNDHPSINIRGYASINGGAPLIVIDGVISDQTQLNYLNPTDIANISVLKDAASAAIYGSRAAYGVILVTTKTGKTEKVTVNYNNNFSLRSLTEKPDYLKDPYVHYNDWNIANGSPVFPTELLETAKAYMADQSKPDGIYLPTMGEYFYVLMGDLYDEFYKKNAFSTNHTIDISGKTDKVNYYLSGNYSYLDGMIRYGTFGYNQYNVRAKLDIQLTPWWKIGSNISHVSAYNKSSSAYLETYNEQLESVTSNFFAPVKLPDGHWYDFTGTFGDFEEGGQAKKYDDTFSQLFTAKIDLIKDVLTLNGQFNYSQQKVKLDYSRLSWDLYVGPDMFDSRANVPNSATARNGTVRHMTYDAYASFNKVFAKKHAVGVILGINQEEYRYNQQNMRKTQLISQNLPSVQLAYGTPTVEELTEEWALRGAYGRLNYILDNKYIVEFNGRYDGTSRFPHDNRYVFNPSGSVAWNISEEQFFTPLKKAVDLFKIRASYGQLGNQDVSAYAYIASMASKRGSYILGGDNRMQVAVPGLVAGNLTWEKVTTADLGIDLTLLNNRLNFSGDIYRRDTRDMLTAGKVLPKVLGTDVPQENSADLKTTGFELSIAWRDQFELAGNPFHYGIDFNLSDSRSEITKFSNTTGTLNSYYKGQKIGEIWGLKVKGLYATDEEAKNGPDQTEILMNPALYPTTAGTINYEDIDDDGKITRGSYTLDDHGDLTVIGNSQVRYRFGSTWSAGWKGIDLSLFFQGVMKHNYAPDGKDHVFFGKYGQPWNVETVGHYVDRWKDDNQDPNAYWPVLTHASASRWRPNREMTIPNDRYLQNAAYVRLKNLTLGYTFPKEWLSRAGIQRLRIFYSGDNLFCASGLYKYYNVDPENLGAHKYPFQRFNSFGLNITF